MTVNHLKPEGAARGFQVVYSHKARSNNVITDIFSTIGCHHALHSVTSYAIWLHLV